MTFSEQDIVAIRTLGYTIEEAKFLYLVAVHSGYFVPGQFLTFTGTKWGKRLHNFTSKLEKRGHVTWREYDRTGGVYHLFSKTLYRLIGKENLRNRRRHSVEFIRTRLVLLDFVLQNLTYDYLETEPEKVRFFCEKLGIPKKVLPAKSYVGRLDSSPTLRYFVDKFPMYLESTPNSSSSLVTLSYVDPGLASLAGFAHHLQAYLPLLQHLEAFSYLYIANSPVHFLAAERCFRLLIQSPREAHISGEIVRYFELRHAWEQKKYGSLDARDVEWLKEATGRFCGDRLETIYAGWVSGRVTEQELHQEFGLAPLGRLQTFRTTLVGPARFGEKPLAKNAEGGLPSSSSPVASPSASPVRQSHD